MAQQVVLGHDGQMQSPQSIPSLYFTKNA